MSRIPRLVRCGIRSQCGCVPTRARVRRRQRAALRGGGIPAVPITTRAEALGLDPSRDRGIEPADRILLAVKPTNHFMAAPGPIAATVIYVDRAGALTRDYRKISYTCVQHPIWPLDAETWPGLIA